MSDMKDRRTHLRYGPLIIRAEFETERGPGEGYLTNLSAGGAFLAVDEPPSRGEILRLHITLPWKLGRITAEAKVVWRDVSARQSDIQRVSGVGLQFTTLPPSAQEAIRAYMTRFSALAASLDETTS